MNTATQKEIFLMGMKAGGEFKVQAKKHTRTYLRSLVMLLGLSTYFIVIAWIALEMWDVGIW